MIYYFAALISGFFSTNALARDPLNDLPHTTPKKLDVVVKTGFVQISESQTEVKAMFFLDHPYTNTLNCEITASVPLIAAGGEERLVKVTMSQELVFPKAAFPSQSLSYDVDLGDMLKEGEKIKPNYHHKQLEAAYCKGLRPNYNLPRSTCVALSPVYDQICKEMAGEDNRRFPIYQNDQYLGSCSCD